MPFLLSLSLRYKSRVLSGQGAMPLKEWKKPLPDGFMMLVRRDTVLGKIVDFAVVLVHDGECITRYDSSHGFAHRDILGRREGLIKKKIYPNMTFKEAFRHALNDIPSNYREYFAFFDGH
jgi:hypothetical protein